MVALLEPHAAHLPSNRLQELKRVRNGSFNRYASNPEQGLVQARPEGRVVFIPAGMKTLLVRDHPGPVFETFMQGSFAELKQRVDDRTKELAESPKLPFVAAS